MFYIWDKVFENGPSGICCRQPLKKLKWLICLSRSCHFKFFKGCLSQISLGPFLNTLSHLIRFLTQVFLLLLKMQLILIHHIGTFFTVCINCYFQTTDCAERCFCASLAPVTCLRQNGKVHLNLFSRGQIQVSDIFTLSQCSVLYVEKHKLDNIKTHLIWVYLPCWKKGTESPY